MHTMAFGETGLVAGIQNRFHLEVKFCCPRWRLTLFLQGPGGLSSLYRVFCALHSQD